MECMKVKKIEPDVFACSASAAIRFVGLARGGAIPLEWSSKVGRGREAAYLDFEDLGSAGKAHCY
jgi:hypothetical protein